MQFIQKIRSKIADLGLDPDDTTAEELYHGLLVKFQTDSDVFDSQYGVSNKSFSEKVQKAIEVVSNNFELPQQWVLKPSAAKNLLRQHPPKKNDEAIKISLG